jgi:hypothetical protein
LDDYCPRERRVTNHAVVAMIEENVKQTRCTTCEAEHVYKGGKAPRRKKSDSTGALYKEVLAGITDQETVPASAVNTMSSIDDPPGDEFDSTEEPAERDDPETVAVVAGAADEPDEIEPDDVQPVDEEPVHARSFVPSSRVPRRRSSGRPPTSPSVRTRAAGAAASAAAEGTRAPAAAAVAAPAAAAPATTTAPASAAARSSAVAAAPAAQIRASAEARAAAAAGSSDRADRASDHAESLIPNR